MGILHNIILLHGGDRGLKLLPSPCVLAVLLLFWRRFNPIRFVAKLLARPFAAEKTGEFGDAYVIESACATQMTSQRPSSARRGLANISLAIM